MRCGIAKLAFGIIAIASFLTGRVEAGSVRISFLNDAAALENTTEVLRNSGCNRSAISTFCRFVDMYYTNGFDLDRSRFSKSQGGFYSFPTMTNLVEALPHRLCDTEHLWSLNCFDAVIILSAGELSTRLQPDENYGPFIVSTQ